MELADASDLVTDAMSALGDKAGTVEEFADMLAKTSQKSNTSVSQLGEAILTVGGTAKMLKGGMAEASTAIGILSDNGIKASEAGTALRNVILNLAHPRNNIAAATMERLGLSAWDAQGNMRPLNEVLIDLNRAMSEMTSEEKSSTMTKIFNKVDLKSINALLANTVVNVDEVSETLNKMGYNAEDLREGINNLAAGFTETTDITTFTNDALFQLGISLEDAEALYDTFTKSFSNSGSRWDELNGHILDSKGAAEDMSETMKNNLKGALTELGSAIEGASIVIGNYFIPFLRKCAEKINELVTKFNEADPSIQKIAITIGVVVAAIGPLLMIFGKMASSVSSIISLATTLGGKFAFVGKAGGMLSTLLGGLSGVALPALAVALVGIAAHLGDNENAILKLQEKWGSLGTIIGGICEFISGVVQIAFGNIVSWVQLAIDSVAAMVDGPGGKTIEDAWTAHTERINKNCEEGYAKLTLTATRGMSNLQTLTDEELSELVNVFDTMTGQVDNIVDGNFSAAAQTLSQQLNGLSNAQLTALTGLNDQTKILFQGIKSSMSLDDIEQRLALNFENMKRSGLTNVEDMDTYISSALETISSQMNTKTQEGADSVQNNLKQATESIKSETNNMGSSASVGMENVANSFMNTSGQIPKEVQSNMNKSVQAVKQAGSDMYNGVRTSFSKLESVGKQHMTNLYKGVGTSMHKLANKCREEASRLYNGCKTSFINIANVGRTQFSRLYNGVTTSMNKLKQNVLNSWSSIRNTLNKPINGKVSITKTTTTKKESKAAPAQFNPYNLVSNTLDNINNSVSLANDEINKYSRESIYPLYRESIFDLSRFNIRGSMYAPQNISTSQNNKNNNDDLDIKSTLQAVLQQNQLLINLLNKDREIVTYVNVDGRQIAKASARYIETELNTFNNRKNRLGGK